MTIQQLLPILVISILLFSCTGQESKKETILTETEYLKFDTTESIEEIVSAIEEGGCIESAHIGIAGSPSEQYARYELLKKIATIEELTILTSHKNSAVRCYAFQALAAKNGKNIFNVLLNHLHDTCSILIRSSCLGLDCFVGDYFIDVVTPGYIDQSLYKLNQKEQQILDSILLYDESILLYAQSRVFDRLEPIEKYYSRVREFVVVERNEFALKMLAKYHKQNDKKLIASFFKDESTQLSAISAVGEFPDNYFYPFVKKVFEKDLFADLSNVSKKEIYFQTLAKFPNAETVTLFGNIVNYKNKIKNDTLKTLHEINDNQLFDLSTVSSNEIQYQNLCKYLLIAITKYPNKLYEPIKNKIKLDEYKMKEVAYELQQEY